MDFLADFVSSLEARRVPSTEPAIVTDTLCRECKQPLIEERSTAGLVRKCNNYECLLFRQPQGIRAKQMGPEMGPVSTKISRTWRSTYPEELRKTKKNYDYLCKVGIRSKLAARHKSNKQTKRIRGMIRMGLSPEFINQRLKRETTIK